MRRHFYLIIFVLIFISGISVSYLQGQDAEPVKGSEIEKSSDKKNDNVSSVTDSTSQLESDSSVKKSLANKDNQDESEKPVIKPAGTGQEAPVEAQNTPRDKAEKEKRTTSASDESTKEADQDVQKPTRIRSDLYLIKRLREVDDEDYKYTRIPGFKKDKFFNHSESSDVKLNNNVVEEEKPVPQSDEDDSEKGLFGLSKQTSDLLTKGSLILFILVILVLYRLRSKGNSRTVLRRFPKR